MRSCDVRGHAGFEKAALNCDTGSMHGQGSRVPIEVRSGRVWLMEAQGPDGSEADEGDDEQEIQQRKASGPATNESGKPFAESFRRQTP